jgi:hypothetical protein
MNTQPDIRGDGVVLASTSSRKVGLRITVLDDSAGACKSEMGTDPFSP